MSIATAFNAAIAIVEGRNQDAIDILRPHLGSEELRDLSSVITFSRRLDEAVKDRLTAEAAMMLKNLLLQEMEQPFPKVTISDAVFGIARPTAFAELSDREANLYLAGRRDTLEIFENKLQSLRTQIKQTPEYEPVDIPE